MKNIVKILSIYFLIFGLPCFGQQGSSIYFSPKYLPGKTYIKSTFSSYAIEFGVQGSKEMLAELKRYGIENPSVQTQEEKEKLRIITDKLSDTDTFPVSVTIKDPENLKLNGITLKGFCKLGKQPVIQSVDSDSLQLEKEQEKNIISAIQGLLQQTKFPDKKINIGDSFSVNTPVSYWMENITVDTKQKSTYFLEKIKKNKAYFIITQNYTVKMMYNNSEFSGTGTGTGKLIYDIKNQQNIYEKSSGEIEIRSKDIDSEIIPYLKMKIITKEKNRIQ